MVRVGKVEVCKDIYLERVTVGLHSPKEKVLLESGSMLLLLEPSEEFSIG